MQKRIPQTIVFTLLTIFLLSGVAAGAQAQPFTECFAGDEEPNGRTAIARAALAIQAARR